MANRAIHRLSQAKVRTAGPGRYADGGGLYLAVGERSRSWVFRFMMAGKLSSRGRPLSQEMGIGSAQDIGLAEARELARGYRAQVHRKPEHGGPVDPLAQRETAKAEQATVRAKGVVTFKAVAEVYLALHSGSWKNSKHAAQWPSSLEAYVYPKIGNLPVKSVDRDLVVKVLEPIWMTKPETARRVRMRLHRIMDHAIGLKAYEGENPASPGPLKTLLATQTDGGNHYKSLSYKKAHTFITELRAAAGTASLALEFLILCATRTGETLLAEWSEIDRQTRTWEVPPEHRKGRLNKEKPLFVPLSNRAIEILDEVEKLTCGVGLIFPNPRGKRLSENAMLEVVKRLGYAAAASPHGFRSTFQGWREDETSYAPELGEHAIGHAVRGVSGDYRRTTALERRRPMMQDWAQFLATPWQEPVGDNVVKFCEGAA